MNVPFVDLRTQYRELKAEIDAAVTRCMAEAAFIGGPEVRAFEREFGEFLGGAGVVGVGNGTDAIHLALRALGIGPGDEVVTSAHTFAATVEAILAAGARPVFADIREDTFCLDPERIEAALTERTRAIVPVHLYGMACDMDRILAIARKHGLRVVEDAAQAHGATWGGVFAGTMGDLGCFSFYPGKNLGAYGDGGAVVSRDAQVLARVRMLADHGRTEKYTHERVGVNSRLDGLQAAVLRVKLRHLAEWNQRRRRAAARYIERLAGVPGLTLPLPPDAGKAQQVYHLFVVRVSDREGLAAHLKSRGIQTGIHYPLPLHLQPAFADLGYRKGDLPVTERVCERILSLPMFPEITDEQVDHVATAIKEHLCA